MNDMDKQFEILLVEDNQDDAKLATRALEKRNLTKRLMWVQDGAEAMDFLLARGKYIKRNKSKRPKVVLLDLNLPKVDGIQVLQNIRLNRELEDLPVVVMTSSEIEKDKLKSELLGVNAYITKPLDEQSFIKAVCEIQLYWHFFNEPPAALMRKN